MVSDGEFADLKREFELWKNRVGNWAVNGLDSFDGLNALEFGAGNMRLSPDGIRFLLTSINTPFIQWVPQLIGTSTAGYASLRSYNTLDGGIQWNRLILNSSSQPSPPNVASAAFETDYVYVAGDWSVWAQLIASAGTGGTDAFIATTVTSDGNAAVGAGGYYFYVPSATIDPSFDTPGAIFLRSDEGHLRFHDGSNWYYLATTADVAAAGASTMPVIVGTTSAQAVGIDLLRFSSTSPSSGTFPANDRAIAIPFVNTETITVVKMWAYNGAAVSGNIDIGIYTEAFAKVVSIGSTAQANTNVLQEFNIADTELAPGRYYMVVAMDNTTGTLFRNATAVEEEKLLGMFQMASAFPLPTTLTPADVASAYLPQIGFSLRTLVA